MPRIVGALHSGPDAVAVAEKLAETHGVGGRYRLSFPEDVVEVPARNPEQTGDLGLGPAGNAATIAMIAACETARNRRTIRCGISVG